MCYVGAYRDARLLQEKVVRLGIHRLVNVFQLADVLASVPQGEEMTVVLVEIHIF